MPKLITRDHPLDTNAPYNGGETTPLPSHTYSGYCYVHPHGNGADMHSYSSSQHGVKLYALRNKLVGGYVGTVVMQVHALKPLE